MFVRLYLAALVVAAMGLFSPVVAADRLNVVASIRPVHSLVASVMGGVGAPALIIDGSGSPHSYVLKPSDAKALQNADAIFWIGPGLEGFLRGPVEKLAKDAASVSLAADAALTLYPVRGEGEAENHGHGHSEHEIDFHIWLDPHNAIAMTKRIAAELAALDPSHADKYRQNAQKTVEQIEVLTEDINAALVPVRDVRFAVHHDSFQYFEKRFGLSTAAALLLHPGTGASLKRISLLADEITATGIKCIFSEPQFNKKLAKKLSGSSGAALGELDPMGVSFAPGPQLYSMMMKSNSEAFKDCLSR